MLIRMIYLSKIVTPQSANLTQSILLTAQNYNKAHNITGVLCEGKGLYLQALEGERRTVTHLYESISSDPRHTNVELIHCETITERRYKDWSMAFVNLSDIEPETNMDWPDFDPYSVTGLLVMARIDDLLAQGSKVDKAL